MPPAVSPYLVTEFCEHVQWTYETWQTATTLVNDSTKAYWEHS